MRLSALNRAETGKREESAQGNDEKREAVSLRSFYFLVSSFFS